MNERRSQSRAFREQRLQDERAQTGEVGERASAVRLVPGARTAPLPGWMRAASVVACLAWALCLASGLWGAPLHDLFVWAAPIGLVASCVALFASLRAGPGSGDASHLAQSEERFRQVLYQATDAMLLVDAEGRIVEANDRAAQLYGGEAEALAGCSLAQLDAGLADALLGPLAERVAVQGASLHTHEVTRPDGSCVPLEVYVGSVEYGAEHYLLLTARDLSERKRLEAQLMLADRMVSVGTLAAGVAHEINNPLTALMLNLELLEHQIRDLGGQLEEPITARLQRGVRRARDGAERVGVIVRDLKTFSRDEAEARTEVELREVIESTLGLAYPELRRYATTTLEYEGHGLVMANHSRLGQVVLNLALNAAHAFGDRPADDNRITVRVRDVGDEVALEVIDNGPGIAADVAARVFDPFFTTKPAGVGTGLGLFICRNIVESFGGRIELESGVGQGATFRVWLTAAPAAARPVTTPSSMVMQGSWPPPPSAVALTGASARSRLAQGARVLLIDDEPAAAQRLEGVLGGRGSVQVAMDTEQARQILALGQPFDLVLCDYELHARSDGSVHAQALAGELPAARRWVFMAGGQLTGEGGAAPANDVLEKPLRGDALWQLLDEGAA